MLPVSHAARELTSVRESKTAIQVFPLITGVGGVRTAFALARFSDMEHIDIAVNIGVAGSFNRTLTLGSVVEVKEDRFADLGVEERDGSFTDVYEMGLSQKDDYLHSDCWIKNQNNSLEGKVEQVRGITVNKVHGHEKSIERIADKYHADVESMEGAAFFYACKNMDVTSLQIRGISNYVEPRNRASWQLEKAITNVNSYLIRWIDYLASSRLHTKHFGP